MLKLEITALHIYNIHNIYCWYWTMVQATTDYEKYLIYSIFYVFIFSISYRYMSIFYQIYLRK